MITKSQLMHLIDRYRRASGGNEQWVFRDQLHVALDELFDDQRPVEWIEAEPDTKGMPLKYVLNGKARGTVIFHSSKPTTSNPVWEVRGQI